MITLLVLILVLNIILAFLVLIAILKITKIPLVKKPESAKNTKLSKKLEKSLEAEIEKLIATAGRRIDAKLLEYFQALVDDAVKKGTELSSFIEKQQGAIVKETQFLAARDITKLREDLDRYRADKFAQIELQIKGMITNVAKQVLGKVIDVSTHEELVKAALERAKREKFMSHE